MSSASRQQQQQQQQQPWRNAERHYCEICNAWMGSDRQSIMLHENGKKHLENQEKAMQQKRKEKRKEEENKAFLMRSLQQMEQAAAMKSDMPHEFQNRGSAGASFYTPIAPVSVSSFVPPPPPPPPPAHPVLKQTPGDEKDKWFNRKKRRENGEEEKNDEDAGGKRRKLISPEEGHYEYGGKVFLEGDVFGELLEEDMPIQIWTGSAMANALEKKLPERNLYWKTAIVAAVRATKAHVAYLATPTDTEESVEKNVPFHRIRIILGSDEMIPTTLEEARLLAMGGEEINVENSSSNHAQVDEATGLSTWSTVTIKRTTVRQEVKEERARLREKRKQAASEEEAKKKEAESRKLEELKVANADDSALGSMYFAELGQEVKGYKGVDISKTGDESLTVADTVGRSISNGKTSVGFKKTKKKPSKNRSRRTTSADDD